jgi:hypothetical protein
VVVVEKELNTLTKTELVKFSRSSISYTADLVLTMS